MINRKRNKQILFRMTEEEYDLFTKKTKECKVSKQHYLLSAALEKDVVSGKEFEELKKLNENVSKLLSAISDCITDLDGIETYLEVYSSVPDEADIPKLIESLKKRMFEGAILWESLRLYLADRSQNLD